jgi:transcriptional regulator with XRE-family HTH domain
MARLSEIGHRIKALRERLGLSKSKLALMCCVTTTAVWNWEENGIVPRSEAFKLAAAALGVSESYLRTGDGNGAPSNPTMRTVAMILDEARNEIATITGVPLSDVYLKMEFVSN